MDSPRVSTQRGESFAYVLPMAVFLCLLAGVGALKNAGTGFWLQSAEYWIYPAQTISCGVILLWFWRRYDLGRFRRVWFAISIAVLVFVLWISPQAFFGMPPRRIGFNPDIFAAAPSAYWATLTMRFIRLVVVVPLVEEIFWRGFLLRYPINEKFSAVPFGTFSWLSFSVVMVAFGLAHSAPDRVAAIVTGALYNCVAYRTKSLASCVLTHAITNLLLGLWIMHTRQWGFW